MKIFTLLLTIGFLVSCASSSKTYSPDGREAYSLNCSGTARNWGMCYEKAGEICMSRGYDVVEKSGEQGASASGYANQSYAGVNASTLHFRTMTIACKRSSVF